jgi:transcriptional regulator with XRE-family HTH domain
MGPLEDSRQLLKTMGGRIRAARNRAGMTQAQLSAGIMTKGHLSAIETGTADPSLVALVTLAGRLRVSVSELIGDAGEEWALTAAELSLLEGKVDQAAAGFREVAANAPRGRAHARAFAGLATTSFMHGRYEEAAAQAADAVEDLSSVYLDLPLVRLIRPEAMANAGDTAGALSLLRQELATDRDEPGAPVWFGLAAACMLRLDPLVITEAAARRRYFDMIEAAAGDMSSEAAQRAARARVVAASGDMPHALDLARQALTLNEVAFVRRRLLHAQLDLGFADLLDGDVDEATAQAGRVANRERWVDDWPIAHRLRVLQCGIEIVRGENLGPAAVECERIAAESERRGHPREAAEAGLVRGRALADLGRVDEAVAVYQRAYDLARTQPNSLLRQAAVLLWSQSLAAAGRFEDAFRVASLGVAGG